MRTLLNKQRVRVVPKALMTSGAVETRLVVPVDFESDGVKKYHLKELKRVGDSMLPAAHGPATRRNIEGRIIVHRDQPKEPHTWTQIWGRHQFCGRGQTEWVEDYVYRTTMRYPRTQLPAEGVEVVLLENAKGERFFSTEVIPIADEERWVTAANVMLEIFGYCWAVEETDLELPLVATRRVNWTILPQGSMPWGEVKPKLDEVISTLRNPVRQNVAQRNLQQINDYEPDQIVIGRGGFAGYVGFCFPEKGFTILESIHHNNATYILGRDWEGLSQLSKAEILDGDLAAGRLVHTSTWSHDLAAWFKRNAA
ncbi:hypothetical protein SAMN02745181_1259 [Rubritalea squalenifaciens DSM 18772]|uniref:Uncharacterized protein n=1 Tax=Rubritalea squalenifaciens DSM 18772 TaxID=1123071 RepID=A0A1M6GT57_9BACT|nr:hypothetical protein [Rubritalea squalenifaciens]SHJ13107.1 hypothetical protein SAMN02745181_1259 [Rubritalea squalenifaciens DSM 18772]